MVPVAFPQEMFMTGYRLILIYQQSIDASLPLRKPVFSDRTETPKEFYVTVAPGLSIPTMAISDVMSAAEHSRFPAVFRMSSLKR